MKKILVNENYLQEFIRQADALADHNPLNGPIELYPEHPYIQAKSKLLTCKKGKLTAVYVFSNDDGYDFSPVLVMNNTGEVILEGDNIHNSDYLSIAEAHSSALGVELIKKRYSEVEEYDELEPYISFLKDNDKEGFLSDIKDIRFKDE